jgi:hypothetical protein
VTLTQASVRFFWLFRVSRDLNSERASEALLYVAVKLK